MLSAAVMGFNGSGYDRARVDNTAALRVSLFGKQAANGDTALALDASGRPTVNLNGAVPAGTNAIGGAYGVSGKLIDENGNVLTVKRAFANVAASTTDGSVIAAVASRKLRILQAAAVAGGTATNITFN